jgi:ubiquinone/menaquinone biosynthesis C-methylase UbiE
LTEDWVSTLRKVGPAQIPEAVLVGGLWTYAAAVLYPARALKLIGASVVGPPVGDLPEGLPQPGLGRQFADGPEAVLLTELSRNADLVEDFDQLAELYEALVRPFSTPIFDEALEWIRNFLSDDSRVLDLGCGPGRELRQVAKLVPLGEVVGVDLAAGMIEVAQTSTRASGLDNCAFFQADVGDLPRVFTDRFDVVYSSLAHHHFPDPELAARNALRCLRPSGVYCIVDPGPEWFNALSAPLCRIGDPGWIGWKTPEEFRALLEGAGFTRTCWIPLLPGFGLAVGQKADGRPQRNASARQKKSATPSSPSSPPSGRSTHR